METRELLAQLERLWQTIARQQSTSGVLEDIPNVPVCFTVEGNIYPVSGLKFVEGYGIVLNFKP